MKKLLMIGLPIIGIIGVAIFTKKVVTEYKKQYGELEEELAMKELLYTDAKVTLEVQQNEYEEILDERNKEIQEVHNMLRKATNEDVDYNGKFVENPELKDMRDRMEKSLEVAAKEKNEDILHNVFKDKKVIAFDIPKDGFKSKIPEKMIEARKEMNEMKYDINGDEAFKKFVQYSLADFQDDNLNNMIETSRMYKLGYRVDKEHSPEDVILMLERLFYFDLPEMVNDFDQNIVEDMNEIRRQFFTDASDFVGTISCAELIIYWVNKLSFDLDGSILAYAWTIINDIGLFAAQEESDVIEIFNRLVEHDYYNVSEKPFVYYGLFSLSQYDTEKLSQDGDTTFKEEYNIFLEEVLNGEE